MDDDLDVGGGSHILASVSRIRTARKAATMVVKPSGPPKTMWGFIYTKYPKPGQPKFMIVDEVRFTALCLIVFAGVCAFGFMVADIGLGRITLGDVYKEGGHGVAVIVGGVFSFLACVLSVVQVRSHWKHWTHPPSQKLVVRILYMVPIYAVSAWLSLTFLDLSSYIDFVRGVYEAFVIYTFMILLTKYLGGHNGVVEWMKYKGPQPWPDPLCCLRRVKPDSKFLYYLKYGALQYTILTPICSLAAVVLTSFGLYEDGVVAYDNGYPYIAFIINCSQLVSLYCLVWLYVVMKNELAPFGPLYKFLVVKAVVFATFWQGVGLALMAKMGWINSTAHFTVGEVQVGMQDFLVCVEMFIAACAHKYTFGSETYADGSLRLIMEQRALYLAEQSYKRAQEAQREAQKLADELAEAADPSLKGKARVEEPETEEEAKLRKKHMEAAIKKAMDEDTEGDVLFDEDEVDWRTAQLPVSGHSSKRPYRSSAFDALYAYELQHQRAEGVDDANGEFAGGTLSIPMTDVDFGIPVDEFAQPALVSSYETPEPPSESASSVVHHVPDDISPSHQMAGSAVSLAVFDEEFALPQEPPNKKQAKLQQKARAELQASMHMAPPNRSSAGGANSSFKGVPKQLLPSNAKPATAAVSASPPAAMTNGKSTTNAAGKRVSGVKLVAGRPSKPPGAVSAPPVVINIEDNLFEDVTTLHYT